LADALVFPIGAVLLLGDEHRPIFCKIDSALIAFFAVALRRAARRAFEEQRHVAAQAELRLVRIGRLALRAFHSVILDRPAGARPLGVFGCALCATCPDGQFRRSTN